MRTVEEVVSAIPGAKVFSVLDAKSRFLQIPLDEAMSLLTIFNWKVPVAKVTLWPEMLPRNIPAHYGQYAGGYCWSHKRDG